MFPTQSDQVYEGKIRHIRHWLGNYGYCPCKNSDVITTEYIYNYSFATEEMAASDSEQRCNIAPISACHCIEGGIIRVSMSDRVSANIMQNVPTCTD